MTGVTRPGSRTTGYTYDALGQLTEVSEGVGTALARDTTFGYDAGGNRTTVTDPLGYVTTTAYDKLGRVSGITDAIGGLVQIAYDKAGRTVSLTDPTGNVTGWAYDAAGRTTTETDPRSKTTTYAYDNADRLTSVTDRIGRVREFGYDAASQRTSEVWKTGGTTLQTQTFGYDAAGNQTSATDPDGSYTLTYDGLDRVTGVSGPWGVTQGYGYDAADNRTSTSDNQGGSSTSTYDNLNRLKTRTQTATGMGTVRADWAYTTAGDVNTVTRYSDAAGTTPAGSTTNTHDALGRLVGIDHKNAAGTSVGTYTYTSDAGDRLTGETFNRTGKSYSYDKLGQLTSDNGSALTYDGSGNRTMSGYTTGTGNRTTADGTWTYTYDDEGQLSGKSKTGEAWAYTYDHAGRMTGASKSATPGGTVTDSVSYKLDAWGNRIERAQTGGTSSTQRYVVDGWDTAKPGAAGTETFEAVMDLDGSNAVTSRRVFGAGHDQAVARQDAGGGVTWYGADGLGTVRQVFDNTGAVTGSRAFTGFGVVTATTGTGLDRYGWTGTVTDPLTGLVGDDARQYDPTLGKWTSDDPIGFGGGDYNVSRAVGNRATTDTDPSGLFDEQRFGEIVRHRASINAEEKELLDRMNKDFIAVQSVTLYGWSNRESELHSYKLKIHSALTEEQAADEFFAQARGWYGTKAVNGDELGRAHRHGYGRGLSDVWNDLAAAAEANWDWLPDGSATGLTGFLGNLDVIKHISGAYHHVGEKLFVEGDPKEAVGVAGSHFLKNTAVNHPVYGPTGHTVADFGSNFDRNGGNAEAIPAAWFQTSVQHMQVFTLVHRIVEIVQGEKIWGADHGDPLLGKARWAQGYGVAFEVLANLLPLLFRGKAAPMRAATAEGESAGAQAARGTAASGAAPKPLPNQAVVNQYGDRAFRKLVGNEGVECTEIAQALQDAAGGAGRQITINPTPGTGGTVRWPTSRGPERGNYHTVYADEHFVYDPRYRKTPIPIAEWEAEVKALNGNENVFGQ